MFEKEAEEYAIENWEHYEEGQNDSKALKQAYLAGAEFGYNKCDEQLNGARVIEKNMRTGTEKIIKERVPIMEHKNIKKAY